MKELKRRIIDMKISSRLMAGFLVIAVLTGILGCLGIYNITSLRGNMGNMEKRMSSLPEINKLQTCLSNMETSSSMAALARETSSANTA